MTEAEMRRGQILTCSGHETDGKYSVLLTEQEFFALWGDSPFFQDFVTKAFEELQKEAPSTAEVDSFSTDWDALWEKISRNL